MVELVKLECIENVSARKLNRIFWTVCATLTMCVCGVFNLDAQLPPIPAGATPVAQGLFGPRGLKFGPGGNLYAVIRARRNEPTNTSEAGRLLSPI